MQKSNHRDLLQRWRAWWPLTGPARYRSQQVGELVWDWMSQGFVSRMSHLSMCPSTRPSSQSFYLSNIRLLIQPIPQLSPISFPHDVHLSLTPSTCWCCHPSVHPSISIHPPVLPSLTRGVDGGVHYYRASQNRVSFYYKSLWSSWLPKLQARLLTHKKGCAAENQPPQ